MSENTKIEWCDHTFNPWSGCTKVSPGCDHCYAEGWSKRAGDKAGSWGAGAARVRTTRANWNEPLKWQRQAAKFLAQHGRRQRVFCASLADVFDNEVPVQWRADLLQLIDLTPDLDWLVLTKRIGNVVPMLTDLARACGGVRAIDLWPRPNIWLGATITSQAEADRDIRKLLTVPARVRFLSLEPLLGPVDLTNVPGPESGHGHHEFSPIITINSLMRADWKKPSIDWVIVGGESGHGARPMHPDWARSLRDQCAQAGVPFLFKQWGEWIGADQHDCPTGPPSRRWMWGDGAPFVYGAPVGALPLLCRAGKKAAGRLLDGVEHNGFPEVSYA